MKEEAKNFEAFKDGRRKISWSPLAQRYHFANPVRLVNLNHLSDALWCKSCNVPLSLRHCTQDKLLKESFAFKISCWQCQDTKEILPYTETEDLEALIGDSDNRNQTSDAVKNDSTGDLISKTLVIGDGPPQERTSFNGQARRCRPPGRKLKKLLIIRKSKRNELKGNKPTGCNVDANVTLNLGRKESIASFNGDDGKFDPEDDESGEACKIMQKCAYCPAEFNEKKSRARHMKNEHPEVRSFFCEICSEEFATIYFLRKHKTESHLPEDSPKCDTCGKAFFTQDLLNAHKLKHLPKEARQFKCSRCSKKFFEDKRLRVHILRFHTKGKCEFKCAHCPRRYETKPKLLRHILEHVQDDIFALKHGHEFTRWKCEYCDKIFKNMGRQLVHMRECHPEFKAFICGWCGEKCTNNKSFQKHRRMNHRTDSLYVCDECGKPSLNPKKLALHKLTHRSGNEGKEFLCSFCPRAFAENSSLVDHIKRFHVITTYYCAHCPKTFKMKFNIRRHMQLHTGEFRHSCQYCGANFVAADGRDHHIRNCHRFMCVICSSIFPTKDEVVVHRIREHSDAGKARDGDQIFEKITDYNCNICYRYLSSKQALNTHLRTHTKKKAKGELLTTD